MANTNKQFSADVDFFSMEIRVSAKNKVEARRKAKAQIVKKILSHINHLYIEEQ